MSILDPPEDTLTPKERIQRGREAAELLNHPVLEQAWREIERLLLLKTLSGNDVAAREDSRRSVQLIHSVQEVLTGFVNDGLTEQSLLDKKLEGGE